MASARRSGEDFSGSTVLGSDETFEYVCQPCASENLQVEAIGYCTDCGDFLCNSCCKAHRKLTGTKHHNMLDKSDMKKSKLRATPTDVLTETCPQHSGKILEYFCKGHKCLCCSVCLNLNHSTCSCKSYVPDISGNFANSPEYRTLKVDTDKLVSMATQQQTRFSDYQMDNDNLKTRALTNIKEYRRQINLILDQLEKDTIDKLSSIHSENCRKIKELSTELGKILSKLNTLKADLDQKESSGKTNQLFVTAKLSQDHMGVYNRKLEEAREAGIARYTFQPDGKFEQTRSALSALWSLSLRQGDTPTQARYVREVCVKAPEDTEECGISGIAVLEGGRVVVTDSGNKAIKLIDMSTNKPVSRLSLSSETLDVTVMKPDQVAVSLGHEEKIEIFTVTKGLTRSRSIITAGAKTDGLCYDGVNFVAACHGQKCVMIIDMSGTTLQTFTNDRQGQPLFTAPCYIALGRTSDTFYVTDDEANTVTTMTTGGDVISVYTHDKLKYPQGVVVGQDGSVYVCSYDTRTIHQLSPTGQLTRIILSEDQGLAWYPWAIAHDRNTDRLMVSSNSTAPKHRNFLRLYQLE